MKLLLANGQLVRTEPSEHLGFIKRQIADGTACERNW
jgi:hypothetical protein